MIKRVYYNPREIVYFSHRYQKEKTVPEGYISDGATGATDIYSNAWWVHDILKEDELWDDGTRCSNTEASFVVYDILVREKRWVRARTWFIATLLWGTITGLCKKIARKRSLLWPYNT